MQTHETEGCASDDQDMVHPSVGDGGWNNQGGTPTPNILTWNNHSLVSAAIMDLSAA
jgi:hypothetical protein